MNTFDLIAHPERIQPAYAFYAIFISAGAVLALLCVLTFRRRWKRFYFLFVFGPLWIVGTLVLMFLDARDVLAVRELVRNGDYSTVEGCLSAFHPGLPYGTKTTYGNERWTVASLDFTYGQGEARPGYHLVEARGGIVHPNSNVRVSFVTSPYYGRREIVRLKSLQPSCPRAPDPGTN